MFKTALIAALTAFICLASPSAYAAMLKYVDKDGEKHFVDEYEKAPPEYRDQLKGQIVIEDESAPKKAGRPPAWLPSPDRPEPVAAPEAQQPQSSTAGGQPGSSGLIQPNQLIKFNQSVKKDEGGFLNRLADFTENSTTGFIVKILAAATLLIIFLGIGARIRSDLKGKKLGALILISITLGVLFYLANSHLRKVDAIFKDAKKQIGEIEKKLAGRNAESDKILKEMQKMDGQALQENIAAHQAAQQELMREQTQPPAGQP